MSDKLLMYMMVISGILFLVIVAIYVMLRKQLNKSEVKRIKQLREGTKEKKFSLEVLYQKLYMFYKQIPMLKGYVLKIRRKLEIINVEDEYKTRMEASKVITKALLIIIPITMLVIALTKNDILLLLILLLFEIFLTDTIMIGMVDKLDTKLLKEQVEFFAAIRHAYHEYNMVEEAIYEVSQNDELAVSRQGEKIHEILLSDNPEIELEKYYDTAPNSYLKEFAGISYLTKEFGDRTIDKSSLYLKNVNNITEEMQLEILKREKLDFKFQSLSVIAIVPVLMMPLLKNWAIHNFYQTNQFYNGKLGLIVQILLVIITFISYFLIRKIKDTGNVKEVYHDADKTWQMKLYKNPVIKSVVNLFIPKKNTKEYRKSIKNLKDAASNQKMETLYVTKLVICIVVLLISISFFTLLHQTAINYIYEEPTTTYDLIGELTEKQKVEAMELTKQDNEILKTLRRRKKVTLEKVNIEIQQSKYYVEATDNEKEIATKRIYKKWQVINSENFKWFDLLISFAFAWMGYLAPTWILRLQKVLRKLEMENEVMQFQTIILMLMKIERVNVEMILEWLERYSNIFREPISKCVNNYEAGAWEALEEFKNEVTFPQLIQIIESLQAAVEKIPIEKAFDELDSEREYYKEKRAAANERLITRKGLIGRFIGFAPLVCIFVGYLIVPMLFIGLRSITDSFANLSAL